MEKGDSWAPPVPRPGALPPPLPTLPGGHRPEGGIVPSPFAGETPALPDRAPDDPNPSSQQISGPVTRAALGPSRHQRRLGLRSRAATAGTLLSMAATLAASYALVQRRSGWIDVRDGRPVTTERLDELDDMVVLLAWADLAVFLIAAIVGIVWFRRAYKNLRTMGRNTHTPGWAFWGWVVPIISLFRPYQMAKELVRESPRHRGNEGTGLVGIWWLSLLSGEFAGQCIAFLQQETADDIILNDTLRVAVHAVTLIAGASWIAIVRVVTARQDAWFEPDPDPQPDVVVPIRRAPTALR